jgi:hypothetical protein
MTEAVPGPLKRILQVLRTFGPSMPRCQRPWPRWYLAQASAQLTPCVGLTDSVQVQAIINN